jgi:urease beta subunit
MSGGGSYQYGDGDIEINVGRRKAKVTVQNTGDRPVQVGSHYHFFEANRALSFDRDKAFGMHLDIASGTAVRFEPGSTSEVELCAFAGHQRLVGFSGLVNGGVQAIDARIRAFREAVYRDFEGAALAARLDHRADEADDRVGDSPRKAAPSKSSSRKEKS